MTLVKRVGVVFGVLIPTCQVPGDGRGLSVEHAGAHVDCLLVEEDADVCALRRRLALVRVALEEVAAGLCALPIDLVEAAVDDDVRRDTRGGETGARRLGSSHRLA